MVMGRVRITSMGLRMALRRARTTATIMAVTNPETATPGSSHAVA